MLWLCYDMLWLLVMVMLCYGTNIYVAAGVNV